MKFFESKEEKTKKLMLRAQEEAALLILPNETVKHVFLLSEDYLILTNKRILLLDKTVGSNQRSIVTIPYNRIHSVSLARGGTAIFSPEIEINVGSSYYDFKLSSANEAIECYQKLCGFLLG